MVSTYLMGIGISSSSPDPFLLNLSSQKIIHLTSFIIYNNSSINSVKLVFPHLLNLVFDL